MHHFVTVCPGVEKCVLSCYSFYCPVHFETMTAPFGLSRNSAHFRVQQGYNNAIPIKLEDAALPGSAQTNATQASARLAPVFSLDNQSSAVKLDSSAAASTSLVQPEKKEDEPEVIIGEDGNSGGPLLTNKDGNGSDAA
jgi:hypothetical protein